MSNNRGPGRGRGRGPGRGHGRGRGRGQAEGNQELDIIQDIYQKWIDDPSYELELRLGKWFHDKNVFNPDMSLENINLLWKSITQNANNHPSDWTIDNEKHTFTYMYFKIPEMYVRNPMKLTNLQKINSNSQSKLRIVEIRAKYTTNGCEQCVLVQPHHRLTYMSSYNDTPDVRIASKYEIDCNPKCLLGCEPYRVRLVERLSATYKNRLQYDFSKVCVGATIEQACQNDPSYVIEAETVHRVNDPINLKNVNVPASFNLLKENALRLAKACNNNMKKDIINPETLTLVQHQ